MQAVQNTKKSDHRSKFAINLVKILKLTNSIYPLLRWILSTWLGQHICLLVLSIDSASVAFERPFLTRGLIKLLRQDTSSVKKIIKTAELRYLKHRSGAVLEAYVLLLITCHEYRKVVQVLETSQAKPQLERVSVQYAYRYALYEIGNFQKTCDWCFQLTQADKDSHLHRFSITNGDFLRSAYASGMCLNHALALWHFGHQFNLTPYDKDLSNGVLSHIKSRLIRQLLSDQAPIFLEHSLSGKKERIGVFFLHAPTALGHAILDPYHYLALYRERYDRIYFIGGDLDSYTPGTRACVEIIQQYGEYLATNDEILLNLSWMSMGQLNLGQLEITIENYWSLLREVSLRTISSDNAFVHNAWHLGLPVRQKIMGEAFCEASGIDLTRPILTLHARDHGYHAITKQEFRNSPIGDYKLAILHLLKSGYQVVRLGDGEMPRMDINDPAYFELPFMDGYENALDAFFIKQSSFMIGSQSGPCSYARALGVPVLSVNAVFSYTLLPAVREMACFKRFEHTDENGHSQELTFKDFFDKKMFQLENLHQFQYLGVSFVNCTPEEILAAVKDMIIWVKSPGLEMTKEQKAFQKLAAKTATCLRTATDNAPPIADYLGISLPGYRISPTVAVMRDSLPLEQIA